MTWRPFSLSQSSKTENEFKNLTGEFQEEEEGTVEDFEFHSENGGEKRATHPHSHGGQ